MIDDINRIYNLYQELGIFYNSTYPEYNLILEQHFRGEFIDRHIKAYNIITKNFNKFDNVVLAYTSDPVTYCYMFRKYFNSNITVVSDHPLLQRTENFYVDNFSVKFEYINPMFEDFTGIENDIVIFPDYEYFVPLDLVNYYNKKLNTAVVYSINKMQYTPGHSIALSVDDIQEMCNFDKEIHFEKFENTQTTTSYCGLGIR